jgi:hypothetical protein
MNPLIFLICLILIALFWRLLLPWVIGLAGLAAIGGLALWIVIYAAAHDPQRMAAAARDEAESNTKYLADIKKSQEDFKRPVAGYSEHPTIEIPNVPLLPLNSSQAN